MTPNLSEQRPPTQVERSRVRPSDWIGGGYVVSSFALTVLSLFLSKAESVTGWLLGQLLGAIVFVQWFVVLHEAGHETLFRTKALNALVGHVASLFALTPFLSWKMVHARHHLWTGWQDLDATTTSLIPRTVSREERLLLNLCWQWSIPLFSVLYRAENFWNLRRLRELFPNPAQHRRLTGNVILLSGAYLMTFGLIGPATLLSLTGLGLLVSLAFQDILLLSQHTHLPQHLSGGKRVRPFAPLEQERFTRSLKFPAWVSTGILMNFDLHGLHHMYAGVPGYRLRHIHYVPRHTVLWWQWIRKAKQVPAEVFLFQNRSSSGFDV